MEQLSLSYPVFFNEWGVYLLNKKYIDLKPTTSLKLRFIQIYAEYSTNHIILCKKIKIDFLDAIHGSKETIKLENGKTLSINTPNNVKEAQQIRLKGQGRPSMSGGPNGDALIEINIKHLLITCYYLYKNIIII